MMICRSSQRVRTQFIMNFVHSSQLLFSSTSSSSSSASVNNIQEQLLLFPEYLAVQSDVSTGKFKQALPSIQRMHEVVTATMGGTSGLAGYLARERARLMQMTGDFTGAHKVLTSGHASAKDDAESVCYIHHITRNHILSGDMQAAELVSEQAVELCEAGGELLPLSLLATTYSMRGLSALHVEDWDAAEEFLQLAARWSQSPLSQLIALNNMGCMHYHIIESEDGQGEDDSHIVRTNECKHIISQGALWKRANASEKLATNDEKAAKEALGYWNDAMAEALKSASDVNNPSAAAAMCGTMGESSFSMLGPGMQSDALSIPKGPNSSVTANGEAGNIPNPVTTKTMTKTQRMRKLSEDEVLAVRLEDSAYAIAYACTICNASIAYAHLGDTARSVELLNSALHALESHKGDISVHPMLGRVLSLLAFDSMAASMAVTAEGLFRAATERLSGPHAMYDMRWKQELALVHGGYGVLLSKWDKREGESVKQLQIEKDMSTAVQQWTGGRVAPPSYIFPPLR